MRTTPKWPLLLALTGACSLVNSPSDHQGGDAATTDTGEPDDAGPPADAGLTALTSEEYCAAYAQIMCAANTVCCDAVLTDCEATYVGGCQPFFDVDPRYLQFDGDKAAAAIALLRPIAATCDLGVADWVANSYFSPLVGLRSPFAECEPANLMPVTVIQEAFSCDRSADPNAICSVNADNEWQCLQRKDEGECYVGTQCTSNRCEFRVGYPLLPGACGPGGMDGSRCSRGRPDQCESLVCEPETALFGVCVARSIEALYCPAPPD